MLSDPLAVDLVERIDYPFAERFGANGLVAQWQALRVLCFDREIRRSLATNPDGTVVALGEGLETQFARVDNGRVRWVTVDLPESVAVRERLLPPDDRQAVIAGDGYRPPPWLWAIDNPTRRALGAERLRFPRGRGLLRLLPLTPIEVLRTRL